MLLGNNEAFRRMFVRAIEDDIRRYARFMDHFAPRETEGEARARKIKEEECAERSRLYDLHQAQREFGLLDDYLRES